MCSCFFKKKTIFLRIDGDSFEKMILIMFSSHPKPISQISYTNVLMSIYFFGMCYILCMKLDPKLD